MTDKSQEGETVMTLPEHPNETESLESLFEMFAQATLAQMNTWILSEGMPQNIRQFIDFDFTKSGGRLRQYETKHAYWVLFSRHDDDPFWSQEVVEQFVRKQWSALQTSPIERPLSSEEIRSLLDAEVLFSIIDVLERYGTFQPTRKQLLESYSRYQEMWTASSIQWDVNIPLTQFTGEGLELPVRLSSHLQLAPFTPEEKTTVWNRPPDPDAELMQPDFPAFLQTRFQLTGSYIVNRDTKWRNPEALIERPMSMGMDAEAEDILTALRLTKAGDVGVLGYFEAGRMPRSYTEGSSFISGPNDQSTGWTDSSHDYWLFQTDLPVVQGVYEALQKLNTQKGGLAVSLRRFNEAYDRSTPEDKIIDLTIALESCLLAGMEGELSYRFSLYGAALLAEAKLWEPEKAQSLLKAMYAIRSAIVHGGKKLSNLGDRQQDLIKKLKIYPSKFPDQCEGIVRDILRTYVIWLSEDGRRSVKTICSAFDQYILKGLASVSSEEGRAFTGRFFHEQASQGAGGTGKGKRHKASSQADGFSNAPKKHTRKREGRDGV
jgi:hypothetical protein